MFVSFLIMLIFGISAFYANRRSLLSHRRFARGYGVVTCFHLLLGIILAAFCQVGTDGKLLWQLFLLLLAVIESLHFLVAIIRASGSRQPTWETQSLQMPVDEPYGPKVVTVTRTDGSVISVPWTGRH